MNGKVNVIWILKMCKKEGPGQACLNPWESYGANASGNLSETHKGQKGATNMDSQKANPS